MKAVVDIGKTHVKLVILSPEHCVLSEYYTDNHSIVGNEYIYVDCEGIWTWLLSCFSQFQSTQDIKKIIFTTHGATAALVSTKTNKLVLPILDYEFDGVESISSEYENLRPTFNETLSAKLPLGLNLGRQLYWLHKNYTEAFESATHILMYPQYWAWRLCGEVSSECTSLGCHTDLWASGKNTFSSLVKNCHWETLLPPVSPINKVVGTITPEIAQQTGLHPNCEVYPGVHDSNASYVRYLLSQHTSTSSFTVISTGTWTILMQTGGDLSILDENKDMLANTDINGNPVSCARFMGGREYEIICKKLGGNIQHKVSKNEIQTAVNQLWMVTPDFSEGNGPFGGRIPELIAPHDSNCAEAIATLYCALMIDQRLHDLQAEGPIFIEGAFLKNQELCALVAQLRASQSVYLSSDSTGTVLGAAHLMQDDIDTKTDLNLSIDKCQSHQIDNLFEYKRQWINRVIT